MGSGLGVPQPTTYGNEQGMNVLVELFFDCLPFVRQEPSDYLCNRTARGTIAKIENINTFEAESKIHRFSEQQAIHSILHKESFCERKVNFLNVPSSPTMTSVSDPAQQ